MKKCQFYIGKNPIGIFFVNIELLKISIDGMTLNRSCLTKKRSKLFSAAVHLYPQIHEQK